MKGENSLSPHTRPAPVLLHCSTLFYKPNTLLCPTTVLITPHYTYHVCIMYNTILYNNLTVLTIGLFVCLYLYSTCYLFPAALVEGTIFAMHGGLSPDLTGIDQVHIVFIHINPSLLLPRTTFQC